MAATIVLKPHPKKGDLAIAIIAGGKLDPPAWGRYTTIGPFDRENTARSFKRADLPAVVGKLAGLAFTVEPALAEGAEAAREETLSRVALAEARVITAEARSGRTLYPFQRDGARWLASRKTALLADEMGTGKTAQSLIAAGSRLVVVCPASLRQNWIREARIWRPDLRGTTIDGVGAFRWPAEGEMVVIGYEGLPASAIELDGDPKNPNDKGLRGVALMVAQQGKALSPAKAIVLAGGLRTGDCPEGVTLVADEGHAFKGSVRKTARVERWRALADVVRAHGGSTWVLTATPLLNKPQELWNVAMCAGIAVEAFGGFRSFCEMAGVVQGRFALEWYPHKADHDALAWRLRPFMLRRMKSEVLAHLPPKQRQTVTVSIAPKAAEQKALDAGLAMLADGAPPEDLDPRMPEFKKLSRALAVLGGLKYEASLDLLASYEDANEPIVVFSTHQASVDALKAREGWVGFHGGTPEDERQQAVDAFQRGDAKGIALTIQAGGVGITLTRARTAIFLERSWTPALDAQAEDRIHRIGQEAAHVTYVTVIADHPIDERISDLHDRKEAFGIGVNAAARTKDETAYAPPPALFVGGALDFATWQAEFLAEKEAADAAAREWAASRGEREAAAKLERAKDRREKRKQGIRAAQGGVRSDLRFGPQSERDQWLMSALTQLALDDEDFSSLENERGFSKSTTGTGHALAWTVDLGWTREQWGEAARIATIHRLQVGTYKG